MTIDVHNHVMPAQALDLLREDSGYGVSLEGGVWRGAHHVPFPVADSFHDPAAKLAELDAKGVGLAVVSPAPTLFFYEIGAAAHARLCEACNDGMAAFCRHRPDRFRWLATLPMQDPVRAAEMYRAAAAEGAAGAAIGTSIAGRRLDEEAFAPFWAAADELALPVLIHPAFNAEHPALRDYYLQNVLGNPLETTVTVSRLICAGVLARRRNVRLVLVHGGGYLPYQAGRLAHACGVRPELPISAREVWDAFGQLYFDTITHDNDALRYVVSRVGPGHVLLGTDMPFDMAMPTPIQTLAAALGEDDFIQVAERNAAALFSIPAADPRGSHRGSR